MKIKLNNELSIKALLIVLFIFNFQIFANIEKPWSFAVISDVHTNSNVIVRINESIVREKIIPEFILFCGDFVRGKSEENIRKELDLWWRLMGQEMTRQGIGIFAVPGNHDLQIKNDYLDRAWKDFWISKGNEITSRKSFILITNSVLFLGLDNFTSSSQPYQLDMKWMQKSLMNTNFRIGFAFGHTALYPLSGKGAHKDTLGMFPEKRDAIVRILLSNNIRTYFAGHDHIYDHSATGNNEVFHQFIVGTGGGGWRNGVGKPLDVSVRNITHTQIKGYMFVTVSTNDITFEMRALRIHWLKRLLLGNYRTVERYTVHY